MLKMLEAILHGKIATENIDTTGHKPVPLPAR